VDPYTREGVWRPNAANDRNLRVMVANPEDLVVGAADPRADGQVVAAAVSRYRSGKVKDLPDAAASKVGLIGANNSSGSTPASDGN
jgi:type IV pilus biogenesis protein CpaD/CtpE